MKVRVPYLILVVVLVAEGPAMGVEAPKDILPSEFTIFTPHVPISSVRAETKSADQSISGTQSDTTYHFYFGNLHSHTSYSDGQSTPAHAFEYARDTAAIDFLAVTDHHCGLSDSEYADILVQADVYTQNGVFVAIGGQEWTGRNDLTSRGRNHINVFEADHVFTAPDYDLDSFYSELLLSDCTGTFNHPDIGSFDNFAYSSIGDVGVNAVEVMDDEQQARYIQLLNNGWHVGTDGSQDNHRADWGDGSTFTVALAGSLTKQDILEATRNHRTYSTLDRNLELTFQANGHWMGETFGHVDNIPFSIGVTDPDAGDLIEHIELYQNGLPIVWADIDSNSYNWSPEITPPRGENYYFVKVLQTDFGKAWSSPIWIECTADLPSTPILSSPAHNAILATLTPTLTWHPSDQADAYTLQYSTSGSFSGDATTVTISGLPDTSYTLADSLTDETWYHWRVQATNDSGTSTPSGTGVFFIDREALFSTDGETRLTTSLWYDRCPSTIQASTELWLVWEREKKKNLELYYQTSSDGGLTWSEETQLTSKQGDDTHAAIAEDLDGRIWVSWDTNRDGNWEIYWKSYDGLSWSDVTNLTQNPSADIASSIFQTADSLMWVLWSSDREDDNYEIYYMTFDGDAWSPETRLTYDQSEDCFPEFMQMEDGELWVVWYSNRDGVYEIYYKIFDGIFWSDDNRLTYSVEYEKYPSIAQTSDGQIWVSYVKGKWRGNSNVAYKTFQDGIWSDESVLPGGSYSNEWSSVTQAFDGRIWMVYSSMRAGNEDIYAQRANYWIPLEAIDDLVLELGGGDIHLWWTQPSAVGIDHYVVYRGLTPYLLGDSLASTTGTTYIDVGATGDTASNFFYMVKAVDPTGRKSEESNQVGEFGKSLPNVK